MAKLTLNKNPEKREIDGNYSKRELLRRVKELEGNELRETDPQEIKTGKPFEGLFPIKPEVLEGVTRSMKAEGYDRTQPVILWKEKDILIDGSTRKKAAIQAGLKSVPVLSVSLPDEETAVQYAYSLQFNRRNLTDADRFTILEGFLCNFAQKIPEKEGGNIATLLSERLHGEGKTRERVAEFLSISSRTAQKYITVLERGPEELKEKVRNGDITINQADKSLKPDDPSVAVKQQNNSNDTPKKPIPSPVKQEENRADSPKTPQKERKTAGEYTDTTYPKKTQNSEDNRPMGANLPSLSEVAIELVWEYAHTETKDGTQIDGIQDYMGKLFHAGWIPKDEYQAIQKTIEQVKESEECQ